MLKRGLTAYETQAQEQVDRKPYDVYRELDLGAGGYAIAPACLLYGESRVDLDVGT